MADIGALALLLGGALFVVVLATVVVLRHRRLATDTSRLLYLALDGRPEEARVEARSSARRFAPVLAALSGDLARPSPRRLGTELLTVFLLFIPPVVLMAYLLMFAQQGTFADRAQAVSTSLLGLAILLPLSTLATATVISAAARSARSVRGSCLTVMAKSARVAVDTDIATVLRQGGTGDPRGA